MRPAGSEDMEVLSQLIADGFADDPRTQYQLRNIDGKHRILKLQAENHLQAFMVQGDVYTLDNRLGVIIGYSSNKIDSESYIKILAAGEEDITQKITEQELAMIVANSQQLDEIDNLLWINELGGDYYHIMAIAIAKQIRGSGAFRELITPFLQAADTLGIPVVLETYNQSNLGIYRHFGFEIYKEFASDRFDFKQYCLIRRPESLKKKENQNEEE